MDLSQLNPQQRKAVVNTVDQSALVIAGAGSGKTRALTYRIAYLIDDKGVSPKNILAVTFTNKAADEMKHRIMKLIKASNIDDLWMGTYHSICVKILRFFGEEIGIPKTFAIYDTSDQKHVMKEVLRILGQVENADAINSNLHQISKLKNKLITPHDYGQEEKKDADQFLHDVYEKYQEKLAQYQALDFDDLIMKTVQLLQISKKARDYMQNRFRYVCLDEVQDTNVAQFALVKLIVGEKNNVFAVGDDFQGIYSFRGAVVDNMINFTQQYPGAVTIKLEQNYRSTKTIVAAGNRLIKHNTKQLEKNLFSENGIGEPIKVFRAMNGEAEARFVAEEIGNLTEFCGYKHSDIAILYRTNAQSRLIEDALMKTASPYQVVGGLSFYERKEIKDTVAFLRLAASPADNIAFGRVFGLWPGLGKTTMEKLARMAIEQNTCLYDAARQFPCKGKTKAQLDHLLGTIDRIHAQGTNNVGDLIKIVWGETGYYESVANSKKPEDESRLENLNELLVMSQDQPDLTEFLEKIALASDQDSIDKADSTKMLTIHSAKGLEWPVVFIVGFEDSIIPHKNSYDVAGIEEERRLAYVAITRAQHELYISHADSRMIYGSWVNNPPSRFLKEIPSNLILRL